MEGEAQIVHRRYWTANNSLGYEVFVARLNFALLTLPRREERLATLGWNWFFLGGIAS